MSSHTRDGWGMVERNVIGWWWVFVVTVSVCKSGATAICGHSGGHVSSD